MQLTFIRLKYSTMEYGSAPEVSDLNSLYCGNAAPNGF